jgi:hypothetical protein
MPDFEARFAAGVELAAWTDPPKPEGPTTGAGGAPPRTNPLPGHGPSYYRLDLGGTVTVEAIVDGVASPADATLSGRFFTNHFAELPIWPPPLIIIAAGQTSRGAFTPYARGHHLVVMRREGGGAVALHFEVE